MIGIAIIATRWNSGFQIPFGRRAATAASARKKPDSRTWCEPVARIPIARQVGSIATFAAVSGTTKCSTVGPACGSSYTALVLSKAPAGTPLAKPFTPSTRNPPSTRRAVPELSSQSEPPLEMSTICSSATRRSKASTGAFWLRQRHASKATTWQCMENASAVELHDRARSRSSGESEAASNPSPPSSEGTAAEMSRAAFKAE